MTREYQIGKRDYQRGLPIEANPFGIISEQKQYNEWVVGWREAKMGIAY